MEFLFESWLLTGSWVRQQNTDEKECISHLSAYISFRLPIKETYQKLKNILQFLVDLFSEPIIDSAFFTASAMKDKKKICVPT